MNLDIANINDEVYDFLNTINQDIDNPLLFTVRKTNRENKLERGFWFYGNENYLAVSFWSGTDWKNRTPNIIFSIVPNGKTYLEMTASDSPKKREFIEKYLVSRLFLKPSGKRFYKEYSNTSYIESLLQFLNEDKKIIDEILKEESKFFDSSDKSDSISFLDEEEFNESIKKVNFYRSQRVKSGTQALNSSLSAFHIKNFGPIHDIKIADIPIGTRWIFLTGENGTGKTSILKALATVLTSRKVDSLTENDFEAEVELYYNHKEKQKIRRVKNKNVSEAKQWVSGFAAYGAIRLATNHEQIKRRDRSIYKRSQNCYSLFYNDGILLDLLYKQGTWNKSFQSMLKVEERMNSIREVLYDIIPNLHKVEFDFSREIPSTSYYEEDSLDHPFAKPTTFDNLASGIKSMLAMIGDLIGRLFDQQPHVTDISELEGIVLIDEIDIHLHPILQRKLVEELDKTFRKLQFIASTHSPIPLLGAPKGSMVFTVKRNHLSGVCLNRVDDKLYLGDLLPNTILSSPIFGFKDIVPKSHEQNSAIRTESSYDEISFKDWQRRQIREFLTEEKERSLIQLFERRSRQ